MRSSTGAQVAAMSASASSSAAAVTRSGIQGGALAGTIPRIHHAQQNGPRLAVEAVQRPGCQKLLANPATGEGRPGPLLAFPKGQFSKGQVQPEPLHAVDGL
ncbi:hypothetical protein [Roseospira marina]|uniref:hypothetical protein n=1 Tax=Roseospira marina TaxID=140057 RepID=UPI0014790949|nr:hypothetical protein [Roseospira marina]MBB5088565.1 hypothetical protein [Roseospira marina]